MLDRNRPRRGRRRSRPGLRAAAPNKGRSFLHVNPERQFGVVRGLASPVRVRILRLLRRRGPLNVNQISEALGLPQSTIATNVQMLEEASLIETATAQGRKGQQKICAARFDEIIIRLEARTTSREQDVVEVEMPLGLYTSYQVGAPCGLCSTEGIIGRARRARPLPRSVPRAGGADLVRPRLCRIQVSQQCEGAERRGGRDRVRPGAVVGGARHQCRTGLPTSALWVNDVKIGTWTSPGDYGDKRGVHTPRWWKLEGSQYGELTTLAHLRRKAPSSTAQKLSS